MAVSPYFTSKYHSQKAYDVIRPNLGFIEFYNLPGPARDDHIALSLNNAKIPMYTNDGIELPYGNDSAWVAGKGALDDPTIEFVDYVDTKIGEILQAWKLLVFNPATGEVGYPSEYKKDGRIIQVDTKGVELRAWHLRGIWPVSLDYGNVDQATSDSAKISGTFKIDRMIPIFAESTNSLLSQILDDFGSA
jgi:hypothetical protein